jgi:hypothetical protein
MSVFGSIAAFWRDPPRIFCAESRVLVVRRKPGDGALSHDRPGAHLYKFIMLANGCKKHPAYRAIRQPRTHCSRCADMWAARQSMKG